MPKATRRRPRSGASLRPRVKVWLELDGRYAFGLGVCEMLQAVEETGSIKEAAARLGKSYRHVWGRIKQVERTTGWALVEARVGGSGVRRSHLTPRARQFVAAFLDLRRRVSEIAEREFGDRFADPSLTPGDA